MERTKAESISDLVNQYLRYEGLETPLNQHRLIESWPKVMGEGIVPFTGDMFIKNQTLHIKIKSAVLKQELMMTRAKIVTQLNSAVGAQVIADIKFL